MKLTIHDDPELLTQRLRALQNLKSSKVKVGLPASAGGRLHWFTKTPPLYRMFSHESSHELDNLQKGLDSPIVADITISLSSKGTSNEGVPPC